MIGGGVLALISATHAVRRGHDVTLLAPKPGSQVANSWGYSRIVREEFDRLSSHMATWSETRNIHECAFLTCRVRRDKETRQAWLVDTIALRDGLLTELNASTRCRNVDASVAKVESDALILHDGSRILMTADTRVLVATGVYQLDLADSAVQVEQDVLTAHDEGGPGVVFDPFIPQSGAWGVPGWGSCRAHSFSHPLLTRAGDGNWRSRSQLRTTVEESLPAQLGANVRLRWSTHTYMERPDHPGRLVATQLGGVTRVVADGGGAFKKAHALAHRWIESPFSTQQLEIVL